MIVATLLLLLHFGLHGNACTTFVVGRKATADGSVMATHSNDGGGKTDPRLVKIDARDHSPGSLRPIYGSPENYPRYVGYERGAEQYFPENCQAGKNNCKSFTPLGYIPEVNHTFAYFEATYGIMNEYQVGIAESTCSGVFVADPIDVGGMALLSIDQLSQIAMERAKTARDAVKIMGNLAEQYGFYGESDSFEGGSESLMVTDPNEGWVFHILADPTGKSAIWVAARVPDDSVAVVANMFSIREVNLEDGANYLGRNDMWQIAEKHGLYHPDNPKDFTATFSDGEYAHKYYSGRRMWGVFRLFSPSANLPAEYGNLKNDAPYPFAVAVDTPVTPQDMMTVMRDWYNGTEYSTGMGLASGPFNSPDRYSGGSGEYVVEGSWERTITIYRSSDTYVVQSRGWLPNAIGGVIWFGPGAAHTTNYVPIVMGMTRAPDCLQHGWQGVYNTSSSYWVHRNVLTLVQVKFDAMMDVVRQVQQQLESASLALVHSVSTGTEELSATSTADHLTQVFSANAEKSVEVFTSLFHYLSYTFADNDVNYWEDGSFHSVSTGIVVILLLLSYSILMMCCNRLSSLVARSSGISTRSTTCEHQQQQPEEEEETSSNQAIHNIIGCI